MEQVISPTRAALLDTFASLLGSDSELSAALEVHGLLSKIYNILYNALSKCVDNMACILAYLFNCASRQNCDVWA